MGKKRTTPRDLHHNRGAVTVSRVEVKDAAQCSRARAVSRSSGEIRRAETRKSSARAHHDGRFRHASAATPCGGYGGGKRAPRQGCTTRTNAHTYYRTGLTPGLLTNRTGDAMEHGTHTGYSYHECRCDECRAANRQYQLRRRSITGQMREHGPWHTGSRANYVRGCRCDQCTKAERDYRRSYRQQKRANR